MTEPLKELAREGQSLWLDNMHRGLLTGGGLKEFMARGVVGITSNPTIFEKAIDGSSDYDSAIRDLVSANRDVTTTYERLVLYDIGQAADLLRPVYEKTQGVDGRVSVEVSPELAHDTDGTIEEARRFWTMLGRPNIMIKVPATPAGIPAIRQLISEGISVNVTLMFSLDHYDRVAQAYIAGIEDRLDHGGAVDRIASVASFFVSRVDTAVDAILEQKIEQADGAEHRAALEALLGKAAIANAQLAYGRFEEVFHSDRFEGLARKGVRVQRPLWASTSAKNPRYRDVMYVESLIGPDTVDTMPDATIAAFADHGVVRRTLGQVDEARRVFAELKALGVDMAAVTQDLQDDGVRSFARSFTTLLQGLEGKMAVVRGVTPAVRQ